MRAFDELMQILATLRSENGCPWDRKQTAGDLKNYLVEEVYELVEAIQSGNPGEITEEIGDVLLNLMLIVTVMKEKHGTTEEEIIGRLNRKLVTRHPHVFGDRRGDSEAQAVANWDRAKKQEENKSLFSGVPVSAPALLKAFMIAKRARKIGFGFEDTAQLDAKLREEIAELENALTGTSTAKTEEEIGDILFTITNLCAFLRITPDDALNKTCDKFLERFKYIEQTLEREGKDFFNTSRERVEQLWEEAKS